MNGLHSNNVLASGRFYDWGDSVVAHPFATLLVPAEDTDDPAALWEAYLAGFADLAPRAELAETARLAVLLAHIARAHTWQRALGPDALDHDFAHGPFEHLRALLPGNPP